MYDLKSIIEANTVDGVTDYEKVMADVDNGYVNPIIAKKTDKTKLMPKITSELIKELGIEGESIDDVKLYIKKMGGSTDEIKEANLALEKSYKELTEKYNSEVESHNKLQREATDLHQTNLIKSLGVEDANQIKFLKWDFNNKVTDTKTFDDVVEEYAKENKVKTTNRFVKDDFGTHTNETDIAEVWRKKREIRRK